MDWQIVVRIVNGLMALRAWCSFTFAAVVVREFWRTVGPLAGWGALIFSIIHITRVERRSLREKREAVEAAKPHWRLERKGAATVGPSGNGGLQVDYVLVLYNQSSATQWFRSLDVNYYFAKKGIRPQNLKGQGLFWNLFWNAATLGWISIGPTLDASETPVAAALNWAKFEAGQWKDNKISEMIPGNPLRGAHVGKELWALVTVDDARSDPPEQCWIRIGSLSAIKQPLKKSRNGRADPKKASR